MSKPTHRPANVRRPAGRVMAAAAWAVVLGAFWTCRPVRAADSQWLYGIHWYGDPNGSIVETMTGGKGIWTLEIVLTNGNPWDTAEWLRDNRFNTYVARGHTILCRIQWNWGWNVPAQADLAAYLAAVQHAADVLKNVVHIWQIGNEPNLYGEWGNAELTPAVYVSMFKQIRTAIRSVSSPLGPQIVLLGPVSPGDVVAGVRHTEGNRYLAQMCDLLTASDVDGFAIHAYAAPWHDAATSRSEFEAGYASQLAVTDTKGFADKPVHLTEWARYVEPDGNGNYVQANEAQSAQFLHGALLDMNSWNHIPGAHPVSSACWFIYPYDDGAWKYFSLVYLRGLGPGGQNNDLWDAQQYACTLNYPTAYPAAGAGSTMYEGTPPGVNIAPQSVSVTTDSGATGPNAVDGVISVSSKWTSEGTVPPHWLQLDLGRARQITGFVVRHAGAAGEPAHFNTSAFQLRTAASIPGIWSIDDLVYNAASANSTARTYNTPKTGRYVRLYITDPGVDDWARIPEFEVYAQRAPADLDNDGDVDLADYRLLAICLGVSGPASPLSPGHACLAVYHADLDGDSDIDLADFTVFQDAYAE